MSRISKLLSIVLALSMVVAAFGCLPALAADNDPNMTAYNNQFTYVVDRGSIPLSGTTLNIFAVPADSYWNPTYFETATAALNVDWTRHPGSTWGITAGQVSAHQIAPGQYASCLTVNISGTVRPDGGPASFRATNPLTGGYVDITVIVTFSQFNDSEYIYTGLVNCQIYDPDENLYEDTALSIGADSHTDGRSYVTAMDGLVAMRDIGLIDSFAESYGYVYSITINGVEYAASGMEGWQYRVYQYDPLDGQYELIPLSEVLGAGDMDLRLANLIQWRYGSYYDPDLFPETIPA